MISRCAAAVLGLVLSACAPEPERVLRAGALALISTDEHGAQSVGPEGRYRVDAFYCGDRTHAVTNVAVQNIGQGPLTLSRIEWLEGLPVQVGDSGPADAQLRMFFEPGQVLESLAVVELPVVFEPPSDSLGGSATLAIHSDDAAPGAASVRFTIEARVISPVCEMPKVIDFGNVAVGFGYQRSVEIRNPTDEPASASVGEIQSSSGDHLAFHFVPGAPAGEFVVPPDSVVQVGVDFRPTSEKTYLAFARMRSGDCCPEQVMQFTGTGVAEVLDWAPEEIDCAEAPVDTEVLRELVVTNSGNIEVSLLNLDQVGTSEFHVVPPAGPAPDRIVLPERGGTATLTIGCTPGAIGLRETTLVIPTTAPAPTQLEIPVRVTGVAP